MVESSRLWRDCRGEARLAPTEGVLLRRAMARRYTAMLSENTQRAFCGRGVPRPYELPNYYLRKALVECL